MLKVKVTVDKKAVRELARKIVAGKIVEGSDEETEMGVMEDLLYQFGGKRQIRLYENIIEAEINPEVKAANVKARKRETAKARRDNKKAQAVSDAAQKDGPAEPQVEQAAA